MESTYQKIRQVRLHPIVHNTQLRAQSLDIVPNVCFQAFNVDTSLIESMKRLLFKRESRRLSTFLRLLVEQLQTLTKLASIICSPVQNWLPRGSGRLKRSVYVSTFVDLTLGVGTCHDAAYTCRLLQSQNMRLRKADVGHGHVSSRPIAAMACFES